MKPLWKTKLITKLVNPFSNNNTSLPVTAIRDKSKTITKNMVGQNISVYDGKTLKILKITEDRIGYKFGEFIPTRKPYIYKGKKKIIKKIK